jgi:hypothetical protein
MAIEFGQILTFLSNNYFLIFLIIKKSMQCNRVGQILIFLLNILFYFKKYFSKIIAIELGRYDFFSFK